MQSRGELARDDLVDSLILVSEGSMALSSSLMVIVTVVLLDKTYLLTRQIVLLDCGCLQNLMNEEASPK